MGEFRIVRLAHAEPGSPIGQDEVFDGFYRQVYQKVPEAAEIFTGAAVRQRYLAWDPRKHFVDRVPGLAERMRAWEALQLELGERALGAGLEGRDHARVGSLVMASCTGYC